MFYQNSIIATETHVYVKASSAIRQCALGAHQLKYFSKEKKVKLILRHNISEDLPWKKYDEILGKTSLYCNPKSCLNCDISVVPILYWKKIESDFET